MMEILTGFQYTVHSNKISGLSPLALILSFLSFKACLTKNKMLFSLNNKE